MRNSNSTSAQTLITTTPNSDEDGNGIVDVEELLSSLNSRTGTDFADGLIDQNLGDVAGITIYIDTSNVN